MRYKKLTDSVYERNIYVVIGSAEEVAPFLRRFGDEEGVDDQYSDGEFIDYDGRYVFWFAKFDDSPASHNLISHEVFHASFEILTNLGMRLSKDSEEAFAYYAGSLTEQIVKFARK